MTEEKSTRKPVKQWVGIVTGIVLPAIAITIFYIWNLETFGGWKGFEKFLTFADVLPKIISLSVLPNLAAFFIFLRFNQQNAARGVLLSTIIIGFVMVIIRFGQ